MAQLIQKGMLSRDGSPARGIGENTQRVPRIAREIEKCYGFSQFDCIDRMRGAQIQLNDMAHIFFLRNSYFFAEF